VLCAACRYGDNPNRVQRHTQFQVILKPDPGNAQELYLGSLEALGIDTSAHDVRYGKRAQAQIASQKQQLVVAVACTLVWWTRLSRGMAQQSTQGCSCSCTWFSCQVVQLGLLQLHSSRCVAQLPPLFKCQGAAAVPTLACRVLS
jgi:hypothetical protein